MGSHVTSQGLLIEDVPQMSMSSSQKCCSLMAFYKGAKKEHNFVIILWVAGSAGKKISLGEFFEG